MAVGDDPARGIDEPPGAAFAEGRRRDGLLAAAAVERDLGGDLGDDEHRRRLSAEHRFLDGECGLGPGEIRPYHRDGKPKSHRQEESAYHAGRGYSTPGGGSMSRPSGEVSSRTFKAGEIIFKEGDDAKSEAFLV